MGEHQDEEYQGNPGNHASAGHVEWTGQGARSDGGVRGGGRGGGSYERAPDGVYGLAGYWSSEPPQGSPTWQGETTCA